MALTGTELIHCPFTVLHAGGSLAAGRSTRAGQVFSKASDRGTLVLLVGGLGLTTPPHKKTRIKEPLSCVLQMEPTRQESV
jgi:hypothetical protein